MTAGSEAKIQKQIKKEVPKIISISIWGKERIHSFLDGHKHLHEEFGFSNFRSPLNIRPEDLQEVIESFRNYIPSDPNNKNFRGDFNYTKIDKKNAINNLSKEYYKYIKESTEKDFLYIEDFLKNPRNKKYLKMYNETAQDFRGVIIAKRNEYDKFDEILEEILNIICEKQKNNNMKPMIIRTFLHFIYFSCDIGKKEGIEKC